MYLISRQYGSAFLVFFSPFIRNWLGRTQKLFHKMLASWQNHLNHWSSTSFLATPSMALKSTYLEIHNTLWVTVTWMHSLVQLRNFLAPKDKEFCLCCFLYTVNSLLPFYFPSYWFQRHCHSAYIAEYHHKDDKKMAKRLSPLNNGLGKK